MYCSPSALLIATPLLEHAAFDAKRVVRRTQYSRPLIKELILQESNEALTAGRAETSSDQFRPRTSVGSIGKDVFNEVLFALPSCTSSSSNCASTEQQRTALL